MTEKWNHAELENIRRQKCVCGREVTSGWLGPALIVIHESPGCDLYRSKFDRPEEFLAHIGEVAVETPPPLSEADRQKALLQVMGEIMNTVVPRLLPLLPRNRPTFPSDCTKMSGQHLRALMELVGGNYGAMIEFIPIEADYIVSFGFLNMMLDFVRRQSDSKVGNA